MRAFCTFIAALILLVFSSGAAAHGMRTAYVELRERDDGRVQVVVRAGASYGGIHVVMPDGCESAGSGLYACERPLRGSTVRIEGLGGVVADAVVIAALRDGTTLSNLARPGSSAWTIPERAATFDTLARYARAGFLHVLAGADHLLFLVALVVVLRRFRAVVLAETAFTISHSIAFSAAALGWVHVPPAVAECGIALSLVLVVLDRRSTRRHSKSHLGWRMAFVFGAVHGLGFAGGLEELGVPRDAVLSALAGFAGGVEIAQVAFLLACFAVLHAARRLSLDGRLASVTEYAVGITGCFWFFQRTMEIIR